MLDIWLPDPLYRLKPWGLIGCGILCGQTLAWPWAAVPTAALSFAGFLIIGLRGLRPDPGVALGRGTHRRPRLRRVPHHRPAGSAAMVTTHRTRYLIRSGGEDCVVTDDLAEALDHYRTLRAEDIDDVQIVVETAQRIPLGPLATRLLLEATPTNPPAAASAINHGAARV